MGDSKRVIPLESNPAVFNQLSHLIGLSLVLEFHDVYSLTEPELLAFLPQPVFAIIMLFPLTRSYEDYRLQTDQSKEVYGNEKFGAIKWFKQTIGNGCGLYALLHALSNLSPDFIIEDLILNEMLLSQLDETSSVEETARKVESLEHCIQLDANYGSQGQTEAPDANESVDLHFITFIKGQDNHLYELDGRRAGPVDLGLASEDSNILSTQLLKDKVLFYMNNANEESKHNFAMVALAPAND